MGIFDKKKSLAELEDETQYAEAEYNLAQKKVLKKEVESRGGTVEAFRDNHGVVDWRRVISWLKGS